MIDSGSNTFAIFEGSIDERRIKKLFGDRTLMDRGAHLLVYLAAALVVFGLTWFFGQGKNIAETTHLLISGGAAAFVFVFGIQQQFASSFTKRHLKTNRQQLGHYKVVVRDEHLDLFTENSAWRIAYLNLFVDEGRSCVRCSTDSTHVQSILLPIEDCLPARTVQEVKGFLISKIRDAKARSELLLDVSSKNLPEPFSFSKLNHTRIALNGGIREKEIVEKLLDSGSKERVSISGIQSIFSKLVNLYVIVVFSALILYSIYCLFIGKHIHAQTWLYLAAFLIFLGIMGYAKYNQLAVERAIEDNPDQETGELNGWVSQFGFAIHYRYGYASVLWEKCEALEIRSDQVIASFWAGDFLIFGKQNFASANEFDLAVRWVKDAQQCLERTN